MLRPLTHGLWDQVHPLRLLRVFELGHRMTVIRLGDGGLVLHSPTPLNELLARALADLGPVRVVLIPSLMHDLFLEPWAERYPEARMLAVPGFAERHRGLRIDAELGSRDDGLPRDELQPLAITGMPRVNETVLLHRPTRTLIVADLLFNFGRDTRWPTSWLLRLVGAHGRPAASRLFRSFVRDRAAFVRSVRRVLELDFDRLVPGHGNVLEHGGRNALRAAYGRFDV